MGYLTKSKSYKNLALCLSFIARRWRRWSLLTDILSQCPSSLRLCHILRVGNNLLHYKNYYAISRNVISCPTGLV